MTLSKSTEAILLMYIEQTIDTRSLYRNQIYKELLNNPERAVLYTKSQSQAISYIASLIIQGT